MENYINLLIAKVLNSEATPEDILQFSTWINADSKNEVEFRRIMSYWHAEVIAKGSPEALKSFSKFSKKFEKRKNKRKNLLLACSVAAAVSLSLIILTTPLLRDDPQVEHVHYYTHLAGNDKSEIILKDGTKIVLNKNSQLTYDNFYGQGSRNITLNGEAYFDVTRDSLNPFVLNLGQASIRVLGTKFNAKSVSGDSEVVATLIEGSIQFQDDSQKRLLFPSEQLTYNTISKKIKVDTIDSRKFTGQTGKILRYKNIPFVDLINELSDRYETNIIIHNRNLKNEELTVSASFEEHQTLEEVLEVISRSLSIKWNKKDNTLYIN